MFDQCFNYNNENLSRLDVFVVALYVLFCFILLTRDSTSLLSRCHFCISTERSIDVQTEKVPARVPFPSIRNTQHATLSIRGQQQNAMCVLGR